MSAEPVETTRRHDPVLPEVEGEPFRSIEQALRFVAENMTVQIKAPDGSGAHCPTLDSSRRAWWRARRRPERGGIMSLH